MLSSAGTAPSTEIATALLPPPDHVVDAIHEGLATHMCLDVVYTARSGETSHRRVKPEALLVRDGVWYLSAWCMRAEGWRQLRLTRITSLEVTTEPIGTLPAKPRRDSKRQTITLIVRGEAAYLADEPEISRAQKLADGTVELTIKAYSSQWAVNYICSLGNAVLAVAPPAIAQAVRERAAAFRMGAR
nr:WYL domain-containing protein [Nanchangia anserum]